MKLTYKSPNGRYVVDFEGKSHSELWGQIGAFQEIFEEDTCGKCGCTNLKYTIRKTTDESGKKDYKYYELRCTKCGAKFQFGILNDGSGNLFPKRNVGTRGWTKYNKETQTEE